MFAIELPKCSCGREKHPFMEGRFVVGLFGAGCAMLCDWCDRHMIPYTESLFMWTELEMLERGSWPRRVADLLPQVDPPTELT